jgi:WD40 repeat protein
MSCSSDTTIKIWDLTKGNCVKTLLQHTDYVKSLSYSSVTNQIASVGLDAHLFVWDLTSLIPIRKYSLHKKRDSDFSRHDSKNISMYCVSMSGSGNIVASGATDGIIRIWDLRSTENHHLKLTGHTENVKQLFLNTDSSKVKL